MGKSIYHLLNDVQVALDDYDQEALSSIEKKRICRSFYKTKKNTLKYKPVYRKAAAAAVIIAMSVALLGTNLSAYAYQTTQQVIYSIGGYLGIEKNLDSYRTVLSQAKTKNGLTVQLNEVILDNDELLVSTTITSDEKSELGCVLSGRVFINGQTMDSASGGSAKPLDEYTTEQVTASYLGARNLEGDLDMKIVFNSALIDEKTKKGPWTFEFTTNGDELAQSTLEIPLHNSFQLENGQKVRLEKYTSNALGQKIYFAKEPANTTYDLALRGHDDLDHKIEFTLANCDASKGVYKISTINGNLDPQARILTLTPYAVKLPEKSGKLSNDFQKVGDEFTIMLTK